MKFTRLRSALFILWMSMFMVESSIATVNITTSRIQYSCNGSTTVFAYNFKVYEDDDLEVIVADSSDSETTLTLNNEYTVSGSGDDAGGNVTLAVASACASSDTLTILRNIDITQDTDYSDGQTLTADGLEAPPDKSRIIDQQFNENSDRSIKVIKSSTLTDLTVVPAANQAIYFNSAGTGLETRDPGSTTLAIPADDSVTGDKINSAEIFVFPTMLNLKKGADVVSASALDLGIDGNSFDITGTTTITSIITKGIGTVVYLHFDASLTLTHHATDLVLPNDNDIVTQTGDVAIFKEYGSGDWELVSYQSNRNTSLGMMRWLKGADVASASDLPLISDGNYFDVTGTTTVTSINGVGVGTIIKVHFDDILTLTHHATNLILPTGENITTAAGDEAEFVEYAGSDWRCINYERADGSSLYAGKMVQQIGVQTGAVNTGATATVFDDSIPQITEGDEYMTLAITPTNANNALLIQVVIFLSNSANNDIVAALFQNSTANALSAAHIPAKTNGEIAMLVINHRQTAGTTSPTTFRVRAGASSGTTTFNGSAGARKLGGVLASSITITEIGI